MDKTNPEKFDKASYLPPYLFTKNSHNPDSRNPEGILLIHPHKLDKGLVILEDAKNVLSGEYQGLTGKSDVTLISFKDHDEEYLVFAPIENVRESIKNDYGIPAMVHDHKPFGLTENTLNRKLTSLLRIPA